MSEIILYSTGCPKCKVLEQKLQKSNVNYSVISDIDMIASKGLLTVPVLEINGNVLVFSDAIKWVNEMR